MRRGADVPDSNFMKMLRAATLAQFLELAERYTMTAMSSGQEAAFDEVGAAWAQKALESGQHLAALHVASTSCKRETVARIADEGLTAHPESTDIVNVLIYRELAGVAPLLAEGEK